MKGALLAVVTVPVVATVSIAVLAGGAAQSPVQARQSSSTAGACLLSTRDGQFSAHLAPEQVANATTIDAVGRDLGIPTYGEIVALATALLESGLHNLPYGDRDSLGLFQQRPSQGWGSPVEVTDPIYAATQFYRHLQAVPGWQRLPLTVAAQAVQQSAYPDAYAKWQAEADALDGALTDMPEATLNCQH